MKIEDLKAGRVYRAKRPRVVHTLYRHLRTLFSTIALKSVLGQNIQ